MVPVPPGGQTHIPVSRGRHRLAGCLCCAAALRAVRWPGQEAGWARLGMQDVQGMGTAGPGRGGGAGGAAGGAGPEGEAGAAAVPARRPPGGAERCRRSRAAAAAAAGPCRAMPRRARGRRRRPAPRGAARGKRGPGGTAGRAPRPAGSACPRQARPLRAGGSGQAGPGLPRRSRARSLARGPGAGVCPAGPRRAGAWGSPSPRGGRAGPWGAGRVSPRPCGVLQPCHSHGLPPAHRPLLPPPERHLCLTGPGFAASHNVPGCCWAQGCTTAPDACSLGQKAGVQVACAQGPVPSVSAPGASLCRGDH